MDRQAQHHGEARRKGQALLAQGKFAEGYATIEQEPGFFRSDDFYKLPKDKKLQPGTPVAGNTVLLALEGGYGDEIAWGRYAQHLAAAGARVLVGALGPSVGTLSTLRGAHQVKQFEHIAPHEYDHYLLGMAAPAYFGTTSPAQGTTFPYIAASPAHTARVRPLVAQFAAGRPKIGVHWQGNPQYEATEQKSYPPELLAPFAQVGQLFSLQRGWQGPLPPGAIDTQQGPASWEHTLATIAEMDYIVTGCTSVAHYAGALGKPVLLILNNQASYYWADATDTTPWYPSVRVFRAPTPGDWASALAQAHAWLMNDLVGRSSTAQKKILVSAVGGLGDHATAEPVVRWLLGRYPGADIRIAAHWPRVFAHLGVPVYPHNSFDAAGYTHVWTLPDPRSPLMQAANFLLCHMADFHALAMLHRQLPVADREIRLGVSQSDRDSLAKKLTADTSKLVVVHAGKSNPAKTFPLPWWQATVDQLAAEGYTVVLVGKRQSDLQDKGDKTGVVEVVCPQNGVDLRDRLPLGELFALLEAAPVLLTNDSSPVQLAGAFDNHIVMIATIKPPDLVFPIRRGTTTYKTTALYKRLLCEDPPFDPLFGGKFAVDRTVDNWDDYLPNPEEVVQKVAALYKNTV